eukprot:scaffold6528_cov114-Cylindrotheca_fusiformis.AAC.3
MIVSSLPDDWFDFPDKDIMIDPAHFASGREPQASPLIDCAGHIFIPVSPDDSHLGGTDKTATSRKQLVLGPWTWPEISIAWRCTQVRALLQIFRSTFDKNNIYVIRQQYLIAIQMPQKAHVLL